MAKVTSLRYYGVADTDESRAAFRAALSPFQNRPLDVDELWQNTVAFVSASSAKPHLGLPVMKSLWDGNNTWGVYLRSWFAEFTIWNKTRIYVESRSKGGADIGVIFVEPSNGRAKAILNAAEKAGVQFRVEYEPGS